jgi:low affinity Fe/Cu permease
MPDKGGDFGSKAVASLAGAAAAFVARKVIIFAWTKATGKEPPGKAEDPDVAIGEALAWTVVLGIGVAVARTLAIRFATRQSSGRLTAPEALR